MVTDHKLFRPAEVHLLCGDASKARKILGWKPEVDLREGIKKIIEWILSIANIFFIGYVGLLIFILIQTWVNDSTFFAANELFWYKTALIRFIVFSGIALVLSLIVYLIDYLIWRFILREMKSSLPVYFSIALFINGILLATIGAIEFFIKKPWF